MVILPDDIILSNKLAKQLIEISNENNSCSVVALESVNRKDVSK